MRMFNLTTLPRRDGFMDMFQDMERVFDAVSRNWPAGDAKSEWLAPRVDVAETNEAFEVSAELPGVSEKDIDVQLEGKVLTIKAERSQEETKGDKTFHLVERRSGSYSRSMTLPFNVEADKVEASFKDGVLSLKLPKPEAAKIEAKKIAVKAN